MTTLDVKVTADWTDIKTSLTLVQGSIYVVDNVNGGPVYIREGSTAPTKTIGHPIGINESRLVTITAEKLWVRTDSPSANLVITVEA